MPTNEDLPTLSELTAAELASDDLIQVYDVSTGRVRTITFANLITALDDGGLAAD